MKTFSIKSITLLILSTLNILQVISTQHLPSELGNETSTNITETNLTETNLTETNITETNITEELYQGLPLEYQKKNLKGNNFGEWEFSEKGAIPDELLEKYAEYKLLDELDSTTEKRVCNYESHISHYNEEIVRNKIIANFKKDEKTNCVPDGKSLISLLENGWTDLVEHLIKEIYLPTNIDPSIILVGYINSSQSKLKSIKNLLKDFSNSKKLKIKFTFENFDDTIKMSLIFPDASYTPDYFSLFCFKDSLKINAIVKSRNRVFRIEDNRKLFSEMVGSCDHQFNSYSNSIDITFEKEKKLKTWKKLFN